MCGPGEEVSTDQCGCRRCSVGHAKIVTNGAGVAISCAACAPGKAPSSDKMECEECPVGRFSTGVACLACPSFVFGDAGLHTLTATELTRGRAGLLEIGLYALSGAVNCSQADDGWQPCTLLPAEAGTGEEYVSNDGSTCLAGVEQCPPGTAGIGGVCEVCPPGTQTTVHRDGCENCPPRFYNPGYTTGCLQCLQSSRQTAHLR